MYLCIDSNLRNTRLKEKQSLNRSYENKYVPAKIKKQQQ